MVTDADGAFQLDVPWAEEEEIHAELTAVADGFVPDGPDLDLDLDLETRDSDAAAIAINLVRGVVLRGTVVDAEGAPVAAAFVGTSRAISTYTDAEGRFALRVLELPVTVRAAYDEGDLGLRLQRFWTRKYVRRLFGVGDQAGLLQGSVDVSDEPSRDEELRIALRRTD